MSFYLLFFFIFRLSAQRSVMQVDDETPTPLCDNCHNFFQVGRMCRRPITLAPSDWTIRRLPGRREQAHAYAQNQILRKLHLKFWLAVTFHIIVFVNTAENLQVNGEYSKIELVWME